MCSPNPHNHAQGLDVSGATTYSPCGFTQASCVRAAILLPCSSSFTREKKCQSIQDEEPGGPSKNLPSARSFLWHLQEDLWCFWKSPFHSRFLKTWLREFPTSVVSVHLFPFCLVLGMPALLWGLSGLSRGASGNTGNTQNFYHGRLTLMNSFFTSKYSWFIVVLVVLVVLVSGAQQSDPDIYMNACMLNHLSHVQLFAMLWTIAHQAPLSMGFSRQEYWSGLPCPPPHIYTYILFKIFFSIIVYYKILNIFLYAIPIRPCCLSFYL